MGWKRILFAVISWPLAVYSPSLSNPPLCSCRILSSQALAQGDENSAGPLSFTVRHAGRFSLSMAVSRISGGVGHFKVLSMSSVFIARQGTMVPTFPFCRRCACHGATEMRYLGTSRVLMRCFVNQSFRAPMNKLIDYSWMDDRTIASSTVENG